MASREEVREEVRQIVADVADLPLQSVTAESTFQELGVDSLRGLRIVVEIEKRYGVVIPEADIGKIRSMKDVLALVDAHTASG